MKIISPNHHPEADKIWRGVLGAKPNGARTLGKAIADNLADVFSEYYDMLVAYASDYPFEIPAGTKNIAVIWHQNYPWVEGFKVWQRVNIRLLDYNVDYFVNEWKLLNLIKDVYKNVYYLPRFIDTREYPNFNLKKNIQTLWFGNAWGEFRGEFSSYKKTNPEPYWVSHGTFGIGEEKLKDIDRKEALKILSRAKKVWAIGVSQLEAQYYGADIISYRDGILDFYDQESIRGYVEELLKKIWAERFPSLGE